MGCGRIAQPTSRAAGRAPGVPLMATETIPLLSHNGRIVLGSFRSMSSLLLSTLCSAGRTLHGS